MAISNSIRPLRSHKHLSVNPHGSTQKSISSPSIPSNPKELPDRDQVVLTHHTDSGIKSARSTNAIDRKSSLKPTVLSRLSARLSIIHKPTSPRLVNSPQSLCPPSTHPIPTPHQHPSSSLGLSSSKSVKRNKSLELGSLAQPFRKDSSLVDDQQSSNRSRPTKHESPHSYSSQSTRSIKPQPRASLFFWKRVSQSTPALNLIDQSQEQPPQARPQTSINNPHHDRIDLNHAQEMVIHTSASSDGHPSSVTSSDMSETLSSSVADTNETSICIEELDDEVFDQESGLAGIGVRDRRSISLFSLPIQIKYNHHHLDPNSSSSHNSLLLAKPIHHPGMRYAPSNSSPLSSRSQSPAGLSNSNTKSCNRHTIKPDSDVYRRSSSALSARQSPLRQPRRASDRPSIHTGRLSLIPNQQSGVASEDLMKLLRGPSSYPAETLPRCNSRSSYVCV